MRAVKIPLESGSQFHFGEFKTDVDIALSSTSEHPHSDTLFSALVNCYSSLKGSADDFIKNFENHICISSVYYYLDIDSENEHIIYLLPKPVFLDIIEERQLDYKKRGRIKYVSKKVWENGFATSSWLEEETYKLIQDGQILITKEEYEYLREALEGNTQEEIASEPIPEVSHKKTISKEIFVPIPPGSETVFSIVDLPKSPVRKANVKDSIFYQTNVEIGNLPNIQIGMYFMYEAKDEASENMLKTAVRVMVHSGIGGEKNNMGRAMREPKFLSDFRFKRNESLINNKAYRLGQSNLSLISPESQEMLNAIMYFNTILRGGARTASEDHYKVIRMIAEGALINESGKIEGHLPIIGMDYAEREVYRNGKALLIPLMYKHKNQAE